MATSLAPTTVLSRAIGFSPMPHQNNCKCNLQLTSVWGVGCESGSPSQSKKMHQLHHPGMHLWYCYNQYHHLKIRDANMDWFSPTKILSRHPSWDSKQPANLSLFRPLRGSQEQGLLFHARPLQLCKYAQCFLKISQCSLATNCTPFQLPPLPMLYDGPTKFRKN